MGCRGSACFVAAVVVAMGCTFDSTSRASEGGLGPSDGSGESDAGEAEGGPSGSRTASGGSMTAAGTSDPPTSSGGEEGADTTGSDPTAESTAGPPDPSTSAAPAEEPLQNAAQTACDLPLWCYYSPDVSNPAGGPIWIFECFESSLTPPLEVVEVNFVVPVRPAGLQAVDFQVRARNGDRPGEVIDQEVVQPASIQEGDNTLVPGWDPIDTTSFCVGFYTDLVDAAGGIGIAADTDSAIQDVSWIQLQKGGGCQYDLVDVMDASPTLVPTGNWCLDIVVREAP